MHLIDLNTGKSPPGNLNENKPGLGLGLGLGKREKKEEEEEEREDEEALIVAESIAKGNEGGGRGKWR